MSSSIDAGYYADRLSKTTETKCKSPKAKKGKHVWVREGMLPSAHIYCKNCKEGGYTK